MTEGTFAQHWVGEGLRYCEAGSGETIVAIVGDEGFPTCAHALLAERRRVIVFAAAGGRRIAAAGRRTDRRRGGGVGHRTL